MALSLETGSKVVATIAAIFGIFFTGYQIREANNTLVFTTEQGIYKESRDILKFIADNPALMQQMRLDDISKLDENARIKLDAQVGVLLNFFNSALMPKNEGYISDEFRNSLIVDFCSLAKLPQIGKRLPTQAGKPFENLANIRRSKCNA